MITVSLIMPFHIYNTFALRSNPCPKYCDGCCVPTKPKNATSLGTSISHGEVNNNINVPNFHGPINSTKATSDNQKALVHDNSPTPPPCPDKGPIPPNCTLKPKF